MHSTVLPDWPDCTAGARTACFVFVLQVITRDEASIWPGMSEPAKAAVKVNVLSCLLFG